ncbi:MAG: 50S ribosomal protein L11 methyltransferase [Pyrinomonadaceae bacterium]
MSECQRKWYAATFSAPAEYEEVLEFAVGQMDALGSEVAMSPAVDARPLEMTVYFEVSPDNKMLRESLSDAARVYGVDPGSIAGPTIMSIEDQDWLAEWKRHWRPVKVGRVVVAAPWHDVDGQDAIVVRIEPSMAFGTGTHETTRSCLEAVQELVRDGDSFLDVGTGTGILAIAAALVAPSAGHIAACDIDKEALKIAEENARSNGVADRIEFVAGTVADIEGEFDVVAANLTADTIVPILDVLIKRAKRALVLSGILAEQERIIVERLPDGGAYRVDRDGEWISIVLTK